MPTAESATTRSPSIAVATAFLATASAIGGAARTVTFLASSGPKGDGVALADLRERKVSSGASRAVLHNTATTAPQLTCVAPAGVALAAGLGAAAAALHRRRREARTICCAGKTATPEEWHQRVRFVEGKRAVFEVTIPKPLGLVPANFPNRPGVGVAKITPDGNTDLLNKKVLIDDEPGMFVLEGDEVIAVNGENVEGQDLSKVGPLVKDSEGDSIKLTLCRSYTAGPVKVVFIPSGKMATMKRGIEISKAAEVGVAELAFSCKEGWCKSCWHTDTMWGTVYRACSAVSKKKPPPKNPRVIPETWDNVMPLVLLNWPESLKRLKERKKTEKQETAAAA